MLHCLVPNSDSFAATGEGPLSGVRTVVKDCLELGGHRSSFGHPRWRETHAAAERDAEAVARLRQNGAEIVGLTKMDQLAYSIIGNAGEGEPPVNTHDPESFCGGSSSGSASAVAGGLAELGVGTDTGGSVRVPAAVCGLYGLRPTHGRISTDGVIPLARSLDVVGFLARRPELLARGLHAAAPDLAGAARFRRVIHLGPLGADADGSAAAELAAGLAARLGAEVEQRDGTELVNPEIGDLMARVQGREIWADHGDWITEHRCALAGDVQIRLDRCESLSADPPATIEADLDARERYRMEVRALVADDAVMVIPVLPRSGPPRRAWSEEQLRGFRLEAFQLTAPGSLAGVPQLVLGDQGGLSLLGSPRSEETLLAIADAEREQRHTIPRACG